MSNWTIEDVPLRRCHKHIRANNGDWDAVHCVWRFESADDAANALACVYAETRATRLQREQLLEMIVEGTAHAAWTLEFRGLTADRVCDVSNTDAERLIRLGERYRHRMLEQFIEQLPPALVAKRFNVAAFERGLQARRARIHHAPLQRWAA